jgi:UDP-2-acetamido-2,6-beta-L-arabino-hexul-4-ose reductase
VNRDKDPQVIYDTNILLTRKLIDAMESTGSMPHVLFSSSTQEERDNPYGKSKRICRELLEEWARKHNSRFTGLVIPNVFGPFGKPFYNSVIATFCYQLTHNEEPHLDVDAELKLIYVNELTGEIRKLLSGDGQDEGIIKIVIPETCVIKVSAILDLLYSFRESYFKGYCFPELSNLFEINLFNTYRSFIDPSLVFPAMLRKNSDQRGVFVETIKSLSGGQFSFSTTLPAITRGNHFHIRKAERFIVIKGKAQIELRKVGTSEVLRFQLDGANPSFVDMPVWYTHNITNTGSEELITLFWTNELFDPSDPDTFFEKV